MVRALILLAALSGMPAAAQPQGPPPAPVVFGLTRLEMVDYMRDVTGEIRPSQRSSLASQEEGLITQLLVREGDTVNEGDVIARLDDRRARIRLRRAESEVRTNEAEVKLRQAELTLAESDLARIRDARERSSATEQEVDDARATYDAAMARLQQARSEQDSATLDAEFEQQRLADMTIRAPFAGRVVSRQTEQGQWVRAGDEIVELIALDSVEVWLDVPERTAAVLKPDAPVRVHVLATDAHIEAEILAIVPQADPAARMFPVRVRVPNPDGTFRPGMSVRASVPTGDRGEMLTVPKDAVLRDLNGSYVFMDADGVAVMVRVKVELGLLDRLVVTGDGLRTGTRVVVEGNERLRPGQAIKAVAGSGDAGPVVGGG